MLLLALVHAQNGPTAVGRVREWVRKGGVRVENKGYYNSVLKMYLEKHLTFQHTVLQTLMLFPHLSRREQSASDGCHG